MPVSRKRVARVMREAGLAGVSRRKGPRTTRRDPTGPPRAGPGRASLRGRGPGPAVGGRHHLRPRPRRDSCTWPSCSTYSAAGWWGGRWPITCAPNWCSTRWTWRWDNDARARSSITPTKAANTRRWPSVNAAANGAWHRQWLGRGLLRQRYGGVELPRSSGHFRAVHRTVRADLEILHVQRSNPASMSLYRDEAAY